MDIIDAHHHLWIPERTAPDLGYGWLRDIGSPKPFGDPTPIQRDYVWPEFSAESATHRLVGSVHVQTDGAVPDPVAETAWLQSVFDGTGLPHAIVGLVDLAAPDVDARLDEHAVHPDFRGVRQILSRLDDDPARSFASVHHLRDPAWREGYALLAGRALSFDLQLYPEQAREAAGFLAQQSGNPVIVDHALSPHDVSAAGRRRWQEAVAALAELDHVSMKLSGFGMFDAGWTGESVRPLVEHLLEHFGPTRVMWGSNYPVEKLARAYDATIEAIARACGDPGDAVLGAVFAGNARRIYGLDRDPPASPSVPA